MFRMIEPRAFVFDPRLGIAGNADPTKPAYNTESNRSYGTRLTWQATQRNKFGFYVANQPRGLGPQDGNEEGCACAAAITGLISYEAGYIQPNKRNSMVIGTWKAPITSRSWSRRAYRPASSTPRANPDQRTNTCGMKTSLRSPTWERVTRSD